MNNFTLAFLVVWTFGLVAGKFVPGAFSTQVKPNQNSSDDWLEWGETGVYAYGLTVAELRTSAEDGTLVYCKLTELQEPYECDSLVKKIGRPVVNVCFDRMMEIITECRNLVPVDIQESSGNSTQSPFWNQVWNGIYPGTKWCGTGDIAKGYHDLGPDKGIDKCCRAHDHCPMKLKSFRRGHGLLNFSLYTKSHCDCDRDFLECLKEGNSESAASIGNMYFNVLRIQCIEEAEEGKDICQESPRSVSKECLNEDTRNILMKFVSPELRYPLLGEVVEI